MPGQTQNLRIYCNWCERETNHEMKGPEHQARQVYDDCDEVDTYSFWVCKGCDHGLLREVIRLSHWPEEDMVCQFFPKRSQRDLAVKRYTKLKPTLATIYQESVTCYNNNALILSTAGLRALLEGICQDKKIKGKNLKAKIDGLKPLLPNKNLIRNLHQFRFMGNEAVHELNKPKPAAVELAISVIEDLLSFFYELDYKAAQLRAMRHAGKVKRTRRLADSANHWADAVVAVVTPEPAKNDGETA